MGRALVNKNKKNNEKVKEQPEENFLKEEVKEQPEEVVADESSEYIETKIIGEKLPHYFEGKKVMRIGARKVIAGKVFYNCECSGGCTYDVPVKNI